MLGCSHSSAKEGSGKCSSSAAHLPALTAIKKCFGGNIGIKEHTLHAFEVLWNVVVVSINVFGFRKLGTCWMGVFLR